MKQTMITGTNSLLDLSVPVGSIELGEQALPPGQRQRKL